MIKRKLSYIHKPIIFSLIKTTHMKNLYFTALFFLFALAANAQSVYPGNMKDGYGGALGKGSLSVSEDATNYYFTFTKGPGDLNDAVVIYLQTRAGGYSTTANFTDEGDGLRKAISGVQGSDRATLTFPSSFRADFAIAFDQGFGGIWELVENGSHNYKNSVGLTPTGTKTSPTYTFTLAKADVGNPPGFEFIATYVSESGYRSNEFIGDDGPATNPQNGPYTVTSTLTFGSPLAIGFSNITAQLNNHSVRISWNTSDEETGGEFKVERSGNGTDFISIGSVTPAKLPTYTYEDNHPLNGKNYYRVVYVNVNGKKTYSKTVSTILPSREALRVFISGDKLKFILDLNQKGMYKAALINTSGQVVVIRPVTYDGSVNTFELPIGNRLSPGIYSLLVKGDNTRMSTQVLIK